MELQRELRTIKNPAEAGFFIVQITELVVLC